MVCKAQIKSAKQAISIGVPVALHTEIRPPYTAEYSAHLQIYYSAYPLYCTVYLLIYIKQRLSVSVCTLG